MILKIWKKQFKEVCLKGNKDNYSKNIREKNVNLNKTTTK